MECVRFNGSVRLLEEREGENILTEVRKLRVFKCTTSLPTMEITDLN